ncbi:MAG: hypothetical protein GY720_16110 [bacterium]|nr:hypothetical protein [bacterium]
MNSKPQPRDEPYDGVAEERRGVPDDLERMLAVVFPAEGLREAARIQLFRYGRESYEREPVRVHLAIVKLSNGDLLKLDNMVDLACQDYRDVLALAEYPAYMQLEPGIDPNSPAARAAIESDRDQYEAWLGKH